MLKEDYVTLEVAKLLKEKGFRELVSHSINKTYRDDRNDVSIWTSDRPENYNDIPEEENHFCKYSCPTIQMAMKWLRENKSFHITVDLIDFLEHGYVYTVKIVNCVSFHEYKLEDTENSYENGCIAGLEYCLKNLV